MSAEIPMNFGGPSEKLENQADLEEIGCKIPDLWFCIYFSLGTFAVLIFKWF